MPGPVRPRPDEHPIPANQNVFAFSHSTAAFEVLQMLAMVIAPNGISDAGAQHYHFDTTQLDTETHACALHCPFSGDLLARGDTAAIPITGHHHAAARERHARKTLQRRPGVRARRALDRIIDIAYATTSPRPPAR